MNDTLTNSSEDDTFAALRAMSFEEALDIAISMASSFPLGTSRDKILEETNYELQRFGWSYEKLNKIYTSTKKG